MPDRGRWKLHRFPQLRELTERICNWIIGIVGAPYLVALALVLIGTLAAAILAARGRLADAQEADADRPFDLLDETLGETAFCAQIMGPRDWPEPEAP